MCFYYDDLCLSIFLQDDENGGGEGKGSENLDIIHPGAGRIKEYDGRKVCDVDVVMLIISGIKRVIV